MDKIQEKRELRREVKRQTAALPTQYITESNNGIFSMIKNLAEFQKANVIFSYLSIEREPDTHRIIEYALSLGKTVLLPVVKGKDMYAARIETLDSLVQGEFGIPCPPADAEEYDIMRADMIMVPAVAFDKSGFRLGRGGGYYDRLLAVSNVVSVGLAREKLMLDHVVIENHDIPVKILVTETRTARLR